MSVVCLPTTVSVAAGKVNVTSAVAAGPFNVTEFVPLSVSSLNKIEPALDAEPTNVGAANFAPETDVESITIVSPESPIVKVVPD